MYEFILWSSCWQDGCDDFHAVLHGYLGRVFIGEHIRQKLQSKNLQQIDESQSR